MIKFIYNNNKLYILCSCLRSLHYPMMFCKVKNRQMPLQEHTTILCSHNMSIRDCAYHCEFGEGIWLQGEAASEAHSFRDAEPHPVIPENAKNNHEIFPKKLEPCNNTNLSTTDFCLPSNAQQ